MLKFDARQPDCRPLPPEVKSGGGYAQLVQEIETMEKNSVPDVPAASSRRFRPVRWTAALGLIVAIIALGWYLPPRLAGVAPEEGSNAASDATRRRNEQDGKGQANGEGERQMETQDTAKATFGGGCFWCTEAVFEEMRGVKKVVSGYSGGRVPNPSYEAVCAGITGHAEVVQVEYDPKVTSFTELLEVFFKTHDPTTLNRQGNDVGTQYRSVIFYHDDQQKQQAEQIKKELDASKAFDAPIVTEVTKLEKFYPAEDYHQDYFRENRDAPYCRMVIEPKLEKVKQLH